MTLLIWTKWTSKFGTLLDKSAFARWLCSFTNRLTELLLLSTWRIDKASKMCALGSQLFTSSLVTCRSLKFSWEIRLTCVKLWVKRRLSALRKQSCLLMSTKWSTTKCRLSRRAALKKWWAQSSNKFTTINLDPKSKLLRKAAQVNQIKCRQTMVVSRSSLKHNRRLKVARNKWTGSVRHAEERSNLFLVTRKDISETSKKRFLDLQTNSISEHFFTLVCVWSKYFFLHSLQLRFNIKRYFSANVFAVNQT